jgi:hypothetical protein
VREEVEVGVSGWTAVLSSAIQTMTHSTTRPERRKHARIAPKGAVTLTLGDVVIRGRVANLSRAGLFTTTNVSAPERLLGREAGIELRLDGPSAEWLQAHGRVVRIDAHGLAVALDSVSTPLGVAIDEMDTQSDLHGRTVSVVLIDGDAARSAPMVEGFRAAGCSVLHVSTPLEAIVRLGESSFEPDLVAIGDTTGGSADELRSFVERNHPRARLVAIGSDEASELVSAWLSSEDPGADLRRRVLELLGGPRRR